MISFPPNRKSTAILRVKEEGRYQERYQGGIKGRSSEDSSGKNMGKRDKCVCVSMVIPSGRPRPLLSIFTTSAQHLRKEGEEGGRGMGEE